jgi:hypothetical protein
VRDLVAPGSITQTETTATGGVAVTLERDAGITSRVVVVAWPERVRREPATLLAGRARGRRINRQNGHRLPVPKMKGLACAIVS